jgi:tetratricopeptide (TPR) repeat protein
MPADPDVQLALGNVYKARGESANAEGCYRNAMAFAPQSAAGPYNLALLFKAADDHAAAYTQLERACNLQPYIADAWRERALALVSLARYPEAIAAGRAAVERDPDCGDFWCCLGYAYQKAHEPQAARECYERARALGARDHEFHNNVAIVHQELGRMDAAVSAYEQAVAAKPDYELARFHLALARLSLRRYERAWVDYDLRLLSEDNSVHVAPHRAWRGEPLAGRSILVMGEQGLGDEIMFASCFGEVIAPAARCIITCAPRLEQLFQRSFPDAKVVAVAPDTRASMEVDYQIAAGSLPRYLRRSASDFPQHTGYLRADPARVEYWKERLASLGTGLKVGISWRGGTHKTRAPLRTLPLSAWDPILSTPDVHFVSLQYGDARSDLQGAPVDVAHWPDAIDDYDETAALVCALDVVISVCTAVIHLAGALGRPVWVMAPLSPEWRYGVAGDTMDWYPSSRIFRQCEFGNWTPVVTGVASELQSRTAAMQTMKSS